MICVRVDKSVPVHSGTYALISYLHHTLLILITNNKQQPPEWGAVAF